MRAQDHHVVRLFIPANFAYDVFLLNGTPNFIWHAEAGADFTRVCANRARKANGVLGDRPPATKCTGNLTAPSSSSRVSPSRQVTGSVNFSVCTSTPSARNAATAHSTALAISGEPVTRPPISSVNRRRFSSSGEGPITCGRILAAATTQEDASAAEHARAPCPGALRLFKGSLFAGGSCARFAELKAEASATRKSKRAQISACCIPCDSSPKHFRSREL